MTAVRSLSRVHAKPRGNTSAFKQGVVWLLVSSIVLSPVFTIREGFYRPSAVDFVLLGLLAYWILGVPLRRGSGMKVLSPPGTKTLFKIVMGLLYVAVISVCAATIVFEQKLIFRDIMILPMIVRHGLILLLAGLWAREVRGRRTLLWSLLFALGLSALVGALQHFNLVRINSWLTPAYVAEHARVVGLELVKLGRPGGRVVGTNGDPRHYAYILVVGIGLSISILGNLGRGIIRRITIVVLGLSLVSLAFAASRTAVLSGGIVFFLAIMVYSQGNRRVSRVVGLLAVVLAMLGLAFPAFESSTFEERVLTLGTASYEHSLNARIRDLTTPFRAALEEPVIWLTGRGPAKAVLRTDSHNDFGWYFYRFGLPGLALYLSLIVSAARISWRCWRHTRRPWERALYMSALLAAVNWFVFAMAENIFKDPQLMALNMLVIGAAAGSCQGQKHR